MSRNLHRAVTVILGLAVLLLLFNRLWVESVWSTVFHGNMTHAPDMAVQYAQHWHEHQSWPRPDELYSRLSFLGSSTEGKTRIDRYACGPYGEHVFEVHLSVDGKLRFFCWSLQGRPKADE